GIGRATAELLAAAGCRVLIGGRREEPLRSVADSSGGMIAWERMDVTEAADRSRMLAAARSAFGRLDILINNAAASVTADFVAQNAEQIRRQIEVNLVAPILLVHEALPLFPVGGSIVNVTSAGARYQGMPPAGMSAYAPSKAGLNQFTRVLATELGPQGIRVNAVAPGLTDTEIAAEAVKNEALVPELVAITPLGRVGQPIDVAQVILFLVSDAAAWVTGQVVDASGGFWLSA
ncbi:MAG: SDR family NAD(P)-dependent oxidoreductase, partial [Gammaproteobacteria bacterium]|nr:SDR family NAD(P)-dependent oxidoreductase [Gammaproteobacteria bacterium]